MRVARTIISTIFLAAIINSGRIEGVKKRIITKYDVKNNPSARKALHDDISSRLLSLLWLLLMFLSFVSSPSYFSSGPMTRVLSLLPLALSVSFLFPSSFHLGCFLLCHSLLLSLFHFPCPFFAFVFPFVQTFFGDISVLLTFGASTSWIMIRTKRIRLPSGISPRAIINLSFIHLQKRKQSCITIPELITRKYTGLDAKS